MDEGAYNQRLKWAPHLSPVNTPDVQRKYLLALNMKV